MDDYFSPVLVEEVKSIVLDTENAIHTDSTGISIDKIRVLQKDIFVRPIVIEGIQSIPDIPCNWVSTTGVYGTKDNTGALNVVFGNSEPETQWLKCFTRLMYRILEQVAKKSRPS